MSVHARVGGSNHPFVAVALTELATLYREQGSPAQALPLLERALAIRERSLGAQHRDVARTLADLASTLSDVGRPTRAQTLAVRAVEIWERQGAPDAPEFATVLALYAKLQANRGDGAGRRCTTNGHSPSVPGRLGRRIRSTPKHRPAWPWHSPPLATAPLHSRPRSPRRPPAGITCA